MACAEGIARVAMVRSKPFPPLLLSLLPPVPAMLQHGSYPRLDAAPETLVARFRQMRMEVHLDKHHATRTHAHTEFAVKFDVEDAPEEVSRKANVPAAGPSRKS